MAFSSRPRSSTPSNPDGSAALGFEPVGLSEEDIHREHRAALEATVFGEHGRSRDEVVFELERGLLRRRGTDR